MSTKVFVGSLPPGCKPAELRHLFTNYGNVVECDIMNRCGFVHLETIEMAEAAIAALNGIEFKGQAIVVEPGRPKDRRGGSSGGGNASTANRRPTQGRGGNSFSRAGNNFRAGGGDGGSNRPSSSSESRFGPVRNEGNVRHHRNAPYSKGQSQHNQNFDGPSQGYKNRFNSGAGGGGGGSGNHLSHSDFHGGKSSGGGNGAGGSHRSSGSSSHHVGQDRRGFALPAVDHQQQQQGHFGNDHMVPNGGNSDSGMYQRNRNSTPGTVRGGFNANRGGFAGRGGFSNRRGGGSGGGGHGQTGSMSQHHGGSFNKHGPSNGHHQHHHQSVTPNSYQSDFPPLGSHGGSVPPNRNRFNGPRPNQHMGGNRRF